MFNLGSIMTVVEFHYEPQGVKQILHDLETCERLMREVAEMTEQERHALLERQVIKSLEVKVYANQV